MDGPAHGKLAGTPISDCDLPSNPYAPPPMRGWALSLYILTKHSRNTSTHDHRFAQLALWIGHTVNVVSASICYLKGPCSRDTRASQKYMVQRKKKSSLVIAKCTSVIDVRRGERRGKGRRKRMRVFGAWERDEDFDRPSFIQREIKTIKLKYTWWCRIELFISTVF